MMFEVDRRISVSDTLVRLLAGFNIERKFQIVDARLSVFIMERGM